MKELSVEEKSRRYDEAIERAKSKINNDKDHVLYEDDVIEIFPELKESEDEKILRHLKAVVKAYDMWTERGLSMNDVLTWLERQGEQKPVISDDALREGITHFGITQYQIDNWLKKYVDIEKQGEWKPIENTETKFKVGDWVVVRGEVILICDIRNSLYGVMFADGEYRHYDTNVLDKDKEAHLWSITDAKDGDILACGDKVTDCPFIFHDLNENSNPRSYCGINTLDQFQVNDENGGFWSCANGVRPATKEQYDLLFQKMKDDGYKWDSESKELIKIEQV